MSHISTSGESTSGSLWLNFRELLKPRTDNRYSEEYCESVTGQMPSQKREKQTNRHDHKRRLNETFKET